MMVYVYYSIGTAGRRAVGRIFYFTMFLVLLFTLYLVVLPNWAAGAVGRISCFTMFLVL